MSKVEKASDDLGKTLGKNKSIVEDIFRSMFDQGKEITEGAFKGFKPVVVKELSPEKAARIKRFYTSKIKNQSLDENKKYAKELIGSKDSQFQKLGDKDKKEVLDLIEESIKDSSDDVFPFNTGGRVGFKNGKGVASLEDEYYGKQGGPGGDISMAEGDCFFGYTNKIPMLDRPNVLRYRPDFEFGTIFFA